MKIICSIKDNAVEAFGPTFEVRARGEALRMFKDEINNTESRINRHPEDFELWEVGEFDDQTGNLIASIPERIARAVDFKQIGEF